MWLGAPEVEKKELLSDQMFGPFFFLSVQTKTANQNVPLCHARALSVSCSVFCNFALLNSSASFYCTSTALRPGVILNLVIYNFCMYFVLVV